MRSQSYTGSADVEVDARGKFVAPGLIDGHVHFRLATMDFRKLATMTEVEYGVRMTALSKATVEPGFTGTVASTHRVLGRRGCWDEVDHVTIYRWVQRFTPLLIDAARPYRRSVGDRWFVDEIYVKVAGVWRYVYRAVDQHVQVIDVYVSKRRDIPAATRVFEAALAAHERPREITTDLAAPLLSSHRRADA